MARWPAETMCALRDLRGFVGVKTDVAWGLPRRAAAETTGWRTDRIMRSRS